MARDAAPVLHDILETIALIETALAGKSREDFGKDDILRLAIQRAIEIISEASRHIPDDRCRMRRKSHGARSGASATFCATNITASPTTSSGM
jgi:uncharacterized protein with HEPN domain